MDQSYIQVGVAAAVCFVIGRWLYTQATLPDTPSARQSALQSQRRTVPQAQIDAVCNAFPQVTQDQARWDLGRSGSVDITIEKILRDGRLPDTAYLYGITQPPPGLFTDPSGAASTSRPLTPSGTTPSSLSSTSNAPTLISKYGLQSRIDDVKGKAREEPLTTGWAASASEREKNLRERKAKMVLEARRKLMEKSAQS